MFNILKNLRNIKNIEIYDERTGTKINNWAVIMFSFLVLSCFGFLIWNLILLAYEIGNRL